MSDHTVQEGRARSNSDKRAGIEPIPRNLGVFLNQMQLSALEELELAGWRLAFVRRPLNAAPMAVLTNSNTSQYGILSDTGSLSTELKISIRD